MVKTERRAKATSRSEPSADLAGRLHQELARPLNGILGPIQLLLEADDDPEERRELLLCMERSAERMLTYLRLGIRLGQLKSGDAPLNLRRQALGPVLYSSLSRMRAPALGKQVRLKVQIGSNPSVAHDPVWLGRAVEALLENSLHFSPVGGQILLALEVVESGRIRITVKDGGPGVCRSELSESNAHLQLALELSDAIAQSHEGGLDCTNLPQGGAHYCLEFSAELAANARSRPLLPGQMI